MKNKKNQILLICGVLIPLLAGILIYFFFFPEMLPVQQLYSVLELSPSGKGMNSGITRFLRNYGPDMLWGIALMSALSLIWKDTGVRRWKLFAAAAVFSAFLECLQLLPSVPGTFDGWDIPAEIVTEAITVLLIGRILREDGA